jgi:hypothetical protein
MRATRSSKVVVNRPKNGFENVKFILLATNNPMHLE